MGIHVLLIEDDETIAEPLTEGLAHFGLRVDHVTTGAEGLRRPYGDVVLLDLGLPDMDGIDVCRGIRQVSDVPVIILSARGEEADRVLGLELGADDYLAKPFSVRELVARVRAVTRRTQRTEAAAEGGDPPATADRARPEALVERLRTEAVAYRERAEAVVERLRAEALAERDRTRGASEGRHARTTAEHGSTPTATEPGRTQAAAEHGRRQAVAGHGRTQAVAEPAVAPPPASYEYTLSASDEAAPPPSDRSARPNPDGDVSSAPGSSPASPPGEGPGPLVVDRRTRRVWVGESPVTLTPKEFELLALLAEDAGAVYSRQQILDRVWDPHYEGPTKTLDVHVASLRRKLGDPAWIQTLRGVGFRLAVQTEPDGRRVPSP